MANRQPKAGENIYWTSKTGGKALFKTLNGDSVVPGVNDFGNMRPRVKGGRTKEVRASIPVIQPVVENLDEHGTTVTTSATSVFSESNYDTEVSTIPAGKQVSLKDLCVEDKKRVANLIKELAKVGEEKENAEKNLQEERQHYEEQIMKLVQQQEEILKEREEVHKKLMEYQNYIMHYKKQKLLEEQRAVEKAKESNTNNNNMDRGKKTIPAKVSVPVEVVKNNHVEKRDAEDDDDDGDDDEEEEEDEDECEAVEQPSRNLYMNQLEETGLEHFSTQAMPPTSPQPISCGGGAKDKGEPRPFTTLIDKELANQRQLLAATLQSSQLAPPTNVYNEKIERQAESSEMKKVKTKEINQFQAASGKHTSRNIYLSPEKNELISRYMESQVEAVSPPNDEPSAKALGSNPKDEARQGRKKHKKRQRPPPTYGPFHPPIMSSTQKSSEFVDLVSVDSSVFSDQIVQKHPKHKRSNKEADDEGDDSYTEEEEGEGMKGKRGGGGGKDVQYSSQKVEFSDNPDKKTTRKYGAGLLDKDAYKKMSADERRRELVKQRTALLEEQNRLREMLREQEQKLKQRQLEVKDNEMTEKTSNEVMQEENKVMENSVAAMERELLRKEEELHKEREMLLRKKEEYSKVTIRQSGGRKEEREEGMTSSGRKIKKQKEEEKHKEPDDQLTGVDGDGCVLYGKNPKPDIVKKLDYSIHSDAEVQTAEPGVHDRSLTPTNERSPDEVKAAEGSDVKGVDVGTSISYAHLPYEDKTSTPIPKNPPSVKKRTPRNDRQTLQSEEGNMVHSPGEKTLTVLEIINSMDNQDFLSTKVAPPSSTNRQSASHSTLREKHSGLASTVPAVSSRTGRDFSDDHHLGTKRGAKFSHHSKASSQFNVKSQPSSVYGLLTHSTGSNQRSTGSSSKYSVSKKQPLVLSLGRQKLNGKSDSGGAFSLSRNNGKYPESALKLRQGRAKFIDDGNNDEDLNLGLFELKRNVALVSNSLQQTRGKIAATYRAEKEEEDFEMDSYTGVYEEEDSNLDDIVDAIDSIEVGDDEYEDVVVYDDDVDVDDDFVDDAEEDVLDIVIKNFGGHLKTESVGSENLGSNYADEEINEDADLSDLEESQILEDVFFVN